MKKKTTKEEKIKKTKKEKNDNKRRKKDKNQKEININHTKKRKRRKWWKKLLSFCLICASFGVFAGFAFCIYIVSTCGEFDPNALASQDQTVIYDSNNNIIAKLGIEKRESVTYDKLPQVLIDAIIATEDSRYFEHNGVDGARFLKASVGQILGNSSAGGASTLTMQVVKNNLTSTEQTITRKFKDIYLAVFFMEQKYTKKEILEFYVNDSLLGGNVYGVEEASKYYFGKSVSELSLPEATIIAGLFQSPNGYNPYYYPERAAKRRATVLKLMVKHGYITEEEADIANAIDVSSLLVGTKEDATYQGYIDTVVAEVKAKTKLDPALTSMEIYTTMNPSIQNGINQVLAGGNYWKDEKVQAGISIVDVKTGAIIAIGTGRNRTGERQWNYATQSYRQPGSTAKPIFSYAPGFEFSNFSTYQLFVDEEWKYTDGSKIGNWDSGYKGLMTLKSALSISRNIPALKAFQTVQAEVGNKKIVEFVEGLGIPLKDKVAYEAYSIGGLSSGVNTLQMAAAYAAFANGGYYTEPYTVKSITYRDTGETTEFEVKKTQAMKDSTAYLITNALEHAARYGFDGGTKGYKGSVAVKTGTSNYDDATLKAKGLPSSAVNDLWSVAYTPEYSISLWYGYDNASNKYYSVTSDGSKYKDKLMAAIMKHIPVTNEKFNQPSSVVAAEVEDGTWPAMKPSQYTPSALIKTEYFIAGTEPTDESPRFAKLNDVTDLKASPTTNGIKLTWEHKTPDVLTDEYLNKYFKQSVFGNSSSKLLQERLTYNNDTLGGLGYGIYIDNKQVAFTTEKNYTYQVTNSDEINFVVKVEYKNFKNNASNGANIKAKGILLTPEKPDNDNDNNDNDNTNNSNKYIIVSPTGGKDLKATLGKYTDSGVTVSYEDKDITNKVSITYILDKKRYSNKSELETTVNKITTPEKITIKYEVTYVIDGEKLTKTASKNISLEN